MGETENPIGSYGGLPPPIACAGEIGAHTTGLTPAPKTYYTGLSFYLQVPFYVYRVCMKVKRCVWQFQVACTVFFCFSPKPVREGLTPL